MRHDIHCGSAVISRQPLAAAHKSAMLTKYIFVCLPSAGGISDGGLNPSTDTNMLLTAYKGGSHSITDIRIYLEHLNFNSSQRLSTSFWNSPIKYSFSGLKRCLNLPCGFKNSSIGSFFFGS